MGFPLSWYVVFDVWNTVWSMSGKCSQSFILGVCVGSAINSSGYCQYACFVHCSFSNSDLLFKVLKECAEIFLCQRSL